MAVAWTVPLEMHAGWRGAKGGLGGGNGVGGIGGCGGDGGLGGGDTHALSKQIRYLFWSECPPCGICGDVFHQTTVADAPPIT